jgi:predicted metal-binding membrane protein
MTVQVPSGRSLAAKSSNRSCERVPGMSVQLPLQDTGRSRSALPSRRETLSILAALVAVVSLAWVYLFVSTTHMEAAASAHAMMGMSEVPWTAAHLALTFLMWAVMMVAMMLPSTAPMILTYAAVNRRVTRSQSPALSIAFFASGYVLVWLGFSIGATLLQWALEHVALLSPALVAASPLLGGSLLIIAGLYQWAPLKEFCLKHCQMPLAFIAHHWRAGRSGALQMGAEHGVYCVGCCWALMLLLFVGGVMNLLWVAAIGVFVLLEKLGARTRVARWISGAGLIVGGGAVMSGFSGF